MWNLRMNHSSGFMYPLVNSHNYGKSTHFSWENSLFLWPFSIANCGWRLRKKRPIHMGWKTPRICCFKVPWFFFWSKNPMIFFLENIWITESINLSHCYPMIIPLEFHGTMSCGYRWSPGSSSAPHPVYGCYGGGHPTDKNWWSFDGSKWWLSLTTKRITIWDNHGIWDLIQKWYFMIMG